MEDDAKLSADTLTGDIRDMLLTHIRAMETPWSKLSEGAQSDKIYAATEAAKSMVRGAVKLVTVHEFPHIVVETGKWTVKDGVKLEVNARQTVENIAALAEHGTKGAVLILVETSVFFGERAPAKPDKDQPDLPIEDKGWLDPDPGFDEPRDPETEEIAADGPAQLSDEIEARLQAAPDMVGAFSDGDAHEVNTVSVTKDGKRQRVTVDELQAELKAGKIKVHGIGDVEMVA